VFALSVTEWNELPLPAVIVFVHGTLVDWSALPEDPSTLHSKLAFFAEPVIESV
jgi:hypothetical protein